MRLDSYIKIMYFKVAARQVYLRPRAQISPSVGGGISARVRKYRRLYPLV